MTFKSLYRCLLKRLNQTPRLPCTARACRGGGLTSPLLRGDVGQAEHLQEALLLLQGGAAVHLRGRVGGGEGRGAALLPPLSGGRRRRTSLLHHPPPLPPLPLQDLAAVALCGQAQGAQELHFLSGRRWSEGTLSVETRLRGSASDIANP